jgi:pimeloyl-ACP methyl ester carboxylesterase
VYVGHSYGSYYGVTLVSRYPKLVDALLLTGFGTRVSAITSTFSASDEVSANQFPRFTGLDPGYLTTKPGARAHHLYYLPDADPAVVEHDQNTEDTLNRGEIATRPSSIEAFTRALPPDLPILVIDGNHDSHYCTTDTYTCSTTSTWFAQVSSTFPQGACLAGALVEAGHDLQLHRSAPTTDQVMLDWATRVIPPTHPAPAECTVRGPIPVPGILPN